MDNQQFFELRSVWEEKQARARYDWDANARPEQRLPLVPFRVWLVRAGRGWGKTRTGSETVRIWQRSFPITNIIGATADSLRDIQIEGPSGILACCPDDERPVYFPARRSLEWPNGARSLLFSAEEPERLRGKQHEKLWCDEIASWKYPMQAFDQAMLGLRLGSNPQCLVTTTPVPSPFIKQLSAAASTYLTKGTTYDNRANLAEGFFTEIISRFEGTRLGRQELLAELLEDNPGALFHLENIERNRVAFAPSDLQRIVVGVDPSGTSTETSDKTGIVVCGVDDRGHFYVLADYTMRGSPEMWARRAVEAFHTFKCDRLVAEQNFGGDMVESIIRNCDPNISYMKVHASRGKQIRCEPISSLYEKNLVHHCGVFGELESQMTEWSPSEKSYSPDNMDALVWALTELSDNGGGFSFIQWFKDFRDGISSQWLNTPCPQVSPRDVNLLAKQSLEIEQRQLGIKMSPTTKESFELPPTPACGNPDLRDDKTGKPVKYTGMNQRVGGNGLLRCNACGYHDFEGPPPRVVYQTRAGSFVERTAKRPGEK